jgi:hypothetical protein
MPGIFDLDLRQFCAEYRANVSVILATGYSERKTQDISPSKKLNIVLNKPFGFNGVKKIVYQAFVERKRVILFARNCVGYGHSNSLQELQQCPMRCLVIASYQDLGSISLFK